MIAANFIFLSAGEFAAKLLAVLAFTHLGRVLGPQAYGDLEFALATLVFFTLPIDLGLGVYGAREIAKNPAQTSRLASEVSAVRFMLAAVSFAVFAILLFLTPSNFHSKSLLAVLGFSLFLTPALLQWVFQGQDRMHWVAWASVIRQITFASFVFLFVRSAESLLMAGAAEVLSILATAIFCTTIARLKMNVRLPLPQWPSSEFFVHLRRSSPIGFSEFCWALLWYSPIVTLGFFVSDRSLGWFGAAHRCLTSLHSFVYLYFFNLLPSLSRCAGEPEERLQRLMNLSLGGVAWAGLFVGLLGTVLSHEIVSILYGAAFRDAATIFSVLVWIIPVTLLSGHFRYGLVAYDLGQQLFHSTLAAAIACVVLSLLLIPYFGALGAAASLLVANVVHFVGPCWLFRKHAVRIPFPTQTLRPVVALAISMGVFWLVADSRTWIAAAVAASVYALCCIVSERPNLSQLVLQLREAGAR